MSQYRTRSTGQHFSFTCSLFPTTGVSTPSGTLESRSVWLLIICPVSNVVVSNTTIPRNNSKLLHHTIQLLILVISPRNNIHVSYRGVKVKVVSWHVKQALRQGKCSSVHTQPQCYMWVGGQRHSLAALPPAPDAVLRRNRPSTHCTGSWTASGPIRTDQEILVFTGFGTPDRPPCHSQQYINTHHAMLSFSNLIPVIFIF